MATLCDDELFAITLWLFNDLQIYNISSYNEGTRLFTDAPTI
jgi:hypothetical protein